MARVESADLLGRANALRQARVVQVARQAETRIEGDSGGVGSCREPSGSRSARCCIVGAGAAAAARLAAATGVEVVEDKVIRVAGAEVVARQGVTTGALLDLAAAVVVDLGQREEEVRLRGLH